MCSSMDKKVTKHWKCKVASKGFLNDQFYYASMILMLSGKTFVSRVQNIHHRIL